MKKKVTSRKIEVKNRSFIAAVKRSFSIRGKQNSEIAEKARASGILASLITANKKKKDSSTSVAN
ncbi:MAG TPA: hypothetical protein VHD83_19635 [Puia sp.]|nr:hypothetical protein [Puia sp.]